MKRIVTASGVAGDTNPCVFGNTFAMLGTLSPAETGETGGIAWHLWTPDPEVHTGTRPAVLICHGGAARKEDHKSFGALAASKGWFALAYDSRGHGESRELAANCADLITDVEEMTGYLASRHRVDPTKVVVRGWCLGAKMALHAACRERGRIAGVIAISPMHEDGLKIAVTSKKFDVNIPDHDSVLSWIDENQLVDDIPSLADVPLLIQHAQGDKLVPISYSRTIFEAAGDPKRFIEIPEGDHRSGEHLPELQAESLDWMTALLEER